MYAFFVPKNFSLSLSSSIAEKCCHRKNKASRSILLILAITKMVKIWHFRELFNFYPILGYYKIITRKNFENPEGKSLKIHLKIQFILKNCSRVKRVLQWPFPKSTKHQNIFWLCLVKLEIFAIIGHKC